MPARRKKKSLFANEEKKGKGELVPKYIHWTLRNVESNLHISMSAKENERKFYERQWWNTDYTYWYIQLERLTLTLRANLWKHWEFSSGLPCSWQNKQSLYSMTMDNILLYFIITSNIYFHFTALPSTTSWHFFPSFSLNSLVDIPMFSSCLLHFCRWVKVKTFTIGQ